MLSSPSTKGHILWPSLPSITRLQVQGQVFALQSVTDGESTRFLARIVRSHSKGYLDTWTTITTPVPHYLMALPSWRKRTSTLMRCICIMHASMNWTTVSTSATSSPKSISCTQDRIVSYVGSLPCRLAYPFFTFLYHDGMICWYFEMPSSFKRRAWSSSFVAMI